MRSEPRSIQKGSSASGNSGTSARIPHSCDERALFLAVGPPREFHWHVKGNALPVQIRSVTPDLTVFSPNFFSDLNQDVVDLEILEAPKDT